MIDDSVGSDRAKSPATNSINPKRDWDAEEAAEAAVARRELAARDAAAEAENAEIAEWCRRLKLSEEDLRVFCRGGYYYEDIPRQDTPLRRELISQLKCKGVPPPKWICVSGLFTDEGYTEVDRRRRIRALYTCLCLLIKRAFARHRLDEFNSERSIYWDPVAEVCRDLEIAPSKLSSYCKEFSGHSLSQVVDCVRAERVKKLMRRQIRTFVQGFKTQCATLAAKNEDANDVWAAWKALRASRKWPAFCQNTWALEFGFSTYRRMYRACMAVWKQTPHQIELALIAEFLKEDTSLPSSSIIEEPELTLEEIDALLRQIQIYSDQS